MTIRIICNIALNTAEVIYHLALHFMILHGRDRDLILYLYALTMGRIIFNSSVSGIAKTLQDLQYCSSNGIIIVSL